MGNLTLRINTLSELLGIIQRIHIESYELAFETYDRIFDNSGNIGVFTHFDDEYKYLKNAERMVSKVSDDPSIKYFELIDPINMPSIKNFPEVSYTHLYLRKPDSSEYGNHYGHIDFNVNVTELKEMLKGIKKNTNQSIYKYGELEMIELRNEKYNSLAYINTPEIAKSIRKRL
ncbi:MAG: hypothetical protein Q9M91_03130 [Candidatus Dojkabacteria bacterium]|nr:hypothetical protein [Candidatus Dojkabacteria bacterium]MDQ7020817.1 hypothetical protein [Candidatus Dojkabacteria bacterium]